MNSMGVILAGGLSTRMKQDKALMTHMGLSLLQRQFNMLEGLLGIGNVIVSGNRPDFPHVSDVDPFLGPLEGLRSVCRYQLDKGRTNSLLVVPVDMPAMTVAGLQRLISSTLESPIVRFAGQQLPILINDLMAVITGIENLQAKTREIGKGKNNVSFENLFKKVETKEIEAEAERFYLNLNSPEDWDAQVP